MKLSGICPSLTPKGKEVKQRLRKCRPRAYSDLIKLDIPGSSGVSPSCSPRSRSPPLPAMEISPEGPLIVKPTLGELQARVDSLAKKKRSVKRKAQDPPESSLPVRGKVLKLGVSISRSLVKEQGSHAQARVKGQELTSLAEVFMEASVQHRSSSAVRAKGSSTGVSEPPLKVLHISV